MMRMKQVASMPMTALLVVAVLSGGARAESIFEDSNLEDAVRQQVHEKRDSDEPLTSQDVQNVATVDASDRGITSLSGLEHCRSLAALNLRGNDVSDLTPLAELSRLQTLDLANNRIEDVSPLAKLKALQRLDLTDNAVADVEPLQGLERMRTLHLSGNEVEDPSPLVGMRRLWSLYLDDNPVRNWELLSELGDLQTLDVSRTGLSDTAVVVAALPSLRLLMMEGNDISDVSPLVDRIEADANDERQFAPFLRVYLRENPLSDDAREQIEAAKADGARITYE